MNETGITAEEACRNHVLTDEDFASMCNQDGSLKNQSRTTTFTLKDDPSQSVTVSDTALYALIVGLVLVLACVVALVVRRRKSGKSSSRRRF